jgi:outer membrane lipoprotein SlyB
VFSNPAGLDCVAVARFLDGKLGTYDELRTFHALQSRLPGACDNLGTTGLIVAVQEQAQPLPRTIVYGLARDRRPVRITIGDKTRVVAPGALGGFIDVRTGVQNLSGASASTTVGHRTVRYRLG